jgi:solute carrier family 25 citrate transporter 1
MAPITASQFGTNRIMEKLIAKYTGKDYLTESSRFACAATAGAVSSFICTPTELVIIQQQVSSSLLWSHQQQPKLA